MKLSITLFTLTLIQAMGLSAATLNSPVYSSTCSSTGGVDKAGTTACSMSAGFGLPNSASSSLSFALASNASSYSVLSGTESAYANLIPGGTRTQVTFDQSLTTTGPVRQGLAYISLSGGGGRSGDGAYSSGSVTFPAGLMASYGCSASDSPSSFNPCHGNANYLQFSGPFTFTLGQSFELSYSGLAYASASALEGSGAYSTTTFSFRFTELDGTPVAVEAVSLAPEPGTWALMGCALTAALMARRRLVKS